MKTTMKNTVIIMLVLLPALTGAAQAGAVEYRNSYQQSTVSYQPSGFGIATTATAPTATFQSTSAYSGQWEQEAQQSMLNNDGTVNSEVYGIGRKEVSGPRRVTPNPDVDPNDPGNVPLGDAMMPLLLLAFAYICARRVRLINKEKRQ